MGLNNLETCTTCGLTYPAARMHECQPFKDTVEEPRYAKLDIREPVPPPYKEPTETLSEGLKFDDGKLQYSLIPPETTKALAEVLTFGASKYGPNNWQLVEEGNRRYLDALFRHLEAYRAGEDVDPESGMSHLAHALTNVAFLHYLETKGQTSE